MTNSTPEDKVKLSEVHKSINRLASQLDKNQSNFTKEMKGISGSISTSSKQQQKILNQMKMRELSSSKDIRAVEKSVNVVLGKLGYVVDAVGRNAKKILIDTARATKEHIKEYGRALSGDFAINKANFVASALAKASPIFGYFAGKFFETTVFKHFTELIREKLINHIQSIFEEEVSRSVSLSGPQRDDYIFRLSKDVNQKDPGLREKNSFDLKNFASQGEHKTFLVALKLSEYDFLKDKKYTSPVLLLEDILSELDESRVSMIISHLKDYGQIFLTTTDKSYADKIRSFYKNEEISEFRIENGKTAALNEKH